MAISLTCVCGNPFSVPDDEAGHQVICPACGELLRASKGDEPILLELDDEPQVKKQPPAEEEIIELQPVEEEDVPEVDVEVETAAWDKKKRRNIDDDDDDEKPRKKRRPEREEPATFADKLEAAGHNSFTSVGTLLLRQTARGCY